jgi:small-conductance mechanosensitive channel
MTGWLHVLTERATRLQEVEHRLTDLHATWSATRTAAQQAQAPEPVLQQIDATLAAIVAAQTPLEAQRVVVLDLQSRIAHEAARCEQMLAQIAQVQQQEVAGILVRDGLPLWHAALWTEVRTALRERVPQVATTYWSDILRYVRNPAEGLLWHTGLFLALALVFGAARRQVQRWQTAGETASSALRVFQHPVAAALLVTLFTATSPFAQIPLTVREVFYIVALLPMLLLTQPVVTASVVPGLYVLGGLFALDIVMQALAGTPRLGQVLLVGALGVGIGFGMQGVVNNFISGLILLFERPIHVGDVVELGAVQGVVRRIGIRASAVHTWQGADIIVPNSQLVTEKVTNWMLTDQLRRIDLPVGVNYGAVPQHVIALLEGVARAHPQVLSDPPPRAFFTGYGDSAINFTLFAWPDHFNNWGQVKSDLTAAVYEAVSAAGMSFPFPQREVRVLHEAEAAIAPINAVHKTERTDT